MNRIPNEGTVWETVRCCELDEVFPFEKRFTDEELLRLQAGPRHGAGTPCWTWMMCGNTLQVYHRFHNNGKWVQVCLFDVEVNADGSVHSIVIHGYRRDESMQQHERRVRKLRSISGPLLDRWSGRYRHYVHSNSNVYVGKRFTAVLRGMRGGETVYFLLPNEGISPETLLEDEDVFRFWKGPEEREILKSCYVNLSMPKLDCKCDMSFRDGMERMGIWIYSGMRALNCLRKFRHRCQFMVMT